MAIKGISTCGNVTPVSVLDRLTAALFLIYFTPLMLAVAFLVKADSYGPVLLRRGGFAVGGKVVRFWEFRTLAAERAPCGVASSLSTQYTPLGLFLKQSRLDLLPRLFNALRGEVSFSGLLT